MRSYSKLRKYATGGTPPGGPGPVRKSPVPLDPSKKFKTVDEHNAYYTSIAGPYLSGYYKTLYDAYNGDAAKQYDVLTLAGGVPDFNPVVEKRQPIFDVRPVYPKYGSTSYGYRLGKRASGGKIAGDALQGALAGSAIAPGIGTLVGGVAGLASGIFGNNEAEEEKKRAEELHWKGVQEEQDNYSRAALSTFPTYGVNSGFGYGGKMLNGNPTPTHVGNVQHISSDTSVYKGPSHEQGGPL